MRGLGGVPQSLFSLASTGREETLQQPCPCRHTQLTPDTIVQYTALSRYYHSFRVMSSNNTQFQGERCNVDRRTTPFNYADVARSEERRVGKECRSRW